MTIVLFGYYGFSNVGDEAILASILQEIRSARPDAALIVSSGNPTQTAAAHGVQAIAWNDVTATQDAIRQADLVAIGGGGLFHDYWGADPDTLLTEKHWGVVYYATAAFLAQLLRKPLMLYAVGVGPLFSGYGVRFTRAICEAAALVTVRDHESLELLQSIGIDAGKIRVTADPAWGFRPKLRTQSTEQSPILPVRRPVLGVAARRWSFGVHPEFLERELAKACDLFAAETDGSVLLLPFHDLRGEREDDRATSERILELMTQRQAASIAPHAVTPAGMFEAVQGCDLLLGMRLHSLIFAAMVGVPRVALSYDPKVDALQQMLGGAAMDVRAIDAAALQALLLGELRAGRVPEEKLQALDSAQRESCSLALDLVSNPPRPVHISADAFDLLQRGVLAQIRESSSYKKESGELTAAVAAFERENGNLRSSLIEVREIAVTRAKQMGDAHSYVQSLLGQIDSLNRQSLELREQIHSWTDWGLMRRQEAERFRVRLESELAAYRGQKAWQVMLLIRKAYTLWTRGSKRNFLRWATGLPVGRIGPLAPYDLSFADMRHYLSSQKPFPGQLEIADGKASEVIAELVPPSHPQQRDHCGVVILAIIDFDFRFQRPQQIAAEMARRGHRVFWISPSRFLAPGSDQLYETAELRAGIQEVHLRSTAPDVYTGELRKEHAEALTEALTALHRDWDIGDHVVLMQLPFWRRLGLRCQEEFQSRLIYDCMDDWETFQNMGGFNVSEEKFLVRECDLLIVTGAELEVKYQGQGLEPLLVRNGADFAFFQSAKENQLLAGVSHPIVGYFGAIADWIDLDLVTYCAEQRPDYSFVLIGQVFGRDVSNLEKLPNVRLLGNQKYEDIPSYLFGFDVCTIPFLLNQVTKATDPVKLYEYFSQGKPVVATDMAELRQCGDLIYIGKTPEEFVAQIDRAVAERDGELVAGRISFARKNTWSARVDLIDGGVKKVFPLVSILIVTYNSEEYVKPCLESIQANSSYPALEVIAVDNASTDGTVELLRSYEDGNFAMRVIALEENTGFAAGNNEAVRNARGEYLIFLNVDTMVTPGWVGRLIRHMERDPGIGLIGPVTNFAGNEAKVNIRYKNKVEMENFAAYRAREFRQQVLDIQVAALFCAATTRTVWEQVGELDTSFGMGMFEDDDFSARVRDRGLRVAVAEDCFVHHFGQGSFAKLPTETYNGIFEKNRQRFEEKWKREWIPHRTRDGVRPAFEEERFVPSSFVA